MTCIELAFPVAKRGFTVAQNHRKTGVISLSLSAAQQGMAPSYSAGKAVLVVGEAHGQSTHDAHSLKNASGVCTVSAGNFNSIDARSRTLRVTIQPARWEFHLGFPLLTRRKGSYWGSPSCRVTTPFGTDSMGISQTASRASASTTMVTEKYSCPSAPTG